MARSGRQRKKSKIKTKTSTASTEHDGRTDAPRCLLTTIPSETRIMIYEALFEGCRIETRAPHVPKGKHGSDTAILAPKIKERWSFLLTCRLVHTEALPILASSSVLEVSLERTISGLSKTFRRDYLQHIQHVVLAQTSVSLPLRLLPNLRQVTAKDQYFASTAVDVYVRKHDLVEMVPYIVGDHDVDYVGRWIDTLEKMLNGTLTAWDPRGRQTVATWNRLQGLDSSVRIVVSTWIHFQLYNAASDSFRGTSVSLDFNLRTRKVLKRGKWPGGSLPEATNKALVLDHLRNMFGR